MTILTGEVSVAGRNWLVAKIRPWPSPELIWGQVFSISGGHMVLPPSSIDVYRPLLSPPIRTVSVWNHMVSGHVAGGCLESVSGKLLRRLTCQSLALLVLVI